MEHLNCHLAKFLFSYRSSAQATTTVSPNELFLQRKLHTRFNSLKLDNKGVVESRQAIQKKNHDKHSKLRSLFIGSPVMVRDFRQTSKWIPGIVLRKLGPVTYHVEVESGKVLKCHIDHLTQHTEQLPVVTDATLKDSTVQDNFQYPEFKQPIQEPVVNDSQLLRNRYPHFDLLIGLY